MSIVSATNQSIFYVYIYLDPRKPGKFKYGEYEFDYEPFLVGKGYGKRWKAHLEKFHLKHDTNKHKINKIKKIRRETGNDPIYFKYKENMLEKEAHNLEILMIKTIGRNDLKLGPLVNLTNGGEGETGRICTNATKRKISKGNKGKHNNPLSEKTKKKISKARKGKSLNLTPEQKEKISKRTKGNKNPMYGVRLYGSTNHFYGKHHSKKTKKILSENHKGINHPMFGKHHTKKTKRKISKGNKGKIINNKTKTKMEKYIYTFINPDNVVFKNVSPQKDFCILHGLKLVSIYDNFFNNKNSNIIKYKNWTIKRKLKSNRKK